jgi:hypothetical protein
MYVLYHDRGCSNSDFVVRSLSSDVLLTFTMLLSECQWMVPGTVNPSDD